LVIFVLHVITKWQWKEVGVEEVELTKNYIKVLATEMGQGRGNNAEHSQGISFLELSGNPVHRRRQRPGNS